MGSFVEFPQTETLIAVKKNATFLKKVGFNLRHFGSSLLMGADFALTPTKVLDVHQSVETDFFLSNFNSGLYFLTLFLKRRL